MAISMVNSVDPTLQTLLNQAQSERSSQAARTAEGIVSGISKDSTEEELTEAVKSFETYFVEQFLKEVKESLPSLTGSGGDSILSQQNDLYLDSTIQSLAETLVDQYGGPLTDSLVSQMKANYGID